MQASYLFDGRLVGHDLFQIHRHPLCDTRVPHGRSHGRDRHHGAVESSLPKPMGTRRENSTRKPAGGVPRKKLRQKTAEHSIFMTRCRWIGLRGVLHSKIFCQKLWTKIFCPEGMKFIFLRGPNSTSNVVTKNKNLISGCMNTFSSIKQCEHCNDT